jgi:hypothetical protein
MSGVEGPGTDLEQKRGQQDKVIPAHENDFDVSPALATPLEVAGGRHSAEPAAENHDPGFRRPRGSGMIRSGQRHLTPPNDFDRSLVPD